MSKKTQNWAVPLIPYPLGNVDRSRIDVNLWYTIHSGLDDLFSTAFGPLKNIGEILRAMSPLILIALGFL
ncbi:MAG: hypothetical protein ACLTYH_08390 [Streptococcus salivarius]